MVGDKGGFLGVYSLALCFGEASNVLRLMPWLGLTALALASDESLVANELLIVGATSSLVCNLGAAVGGPSTVGCSDLFMLTGSPPPLLR